jgi:hypothetical protein
VSTSVGAGRSGTLIQHWAHPFFLTSPTSDMQPPGVPRVAVGLPAEVVAGFGPATSGCGGG